MLSPHLTVEEAYLLAKYVRGVDPQAAGRAGAGAGRGRGRDVQERLHDSRREVPESPRRRRDRRALHGPASSTFDDLLAELDSGEIARACGSAAATSSDWIDDADGRAARRRRRASSCRTCSLRRCWSGPTYRLPGAAFAEREGSYVNSCRSAASVALGRFVRRPACGPKGSCTGNCSGEPGLYKPRRVLDEVAARDSRSSPPRPSRSVRWASI